MTVLVLDAGGVDAVADMNRRRVIRDRGLWPPVLSVVTIAEAITGDAHHDHGPNGVLGVSMIEPVLESDARSAGRLRYLARRGGADPAPGTVDALVIALADRLAQRDDVVVLTSDPGDLSLLATHARQPARIRIAAR